MAERIRPPARRRVAPPRGWWRMACLNPTNTCSSNRASKYLGPAGFSCGPRAEITEWLTFAWEEMLWKSFVERFFSEPLSSIAPRKYDLHNCEFFSMGQI